MKTQNYHHYKRYYPPHHFIFLPMMGILIGVGIVKAWQEPSHKLEWVLFAILSFCILYLAIMLRQHYALGNQDRIVRLEFRLRYFEFFGTPSDKAEEKLSFAQIAALRFADNRQFIILTERTLKENMSSEEIKKAILNWQADTMRL